MGLGRFLMPLLANFWGAALYAAEPPKMGKITFENSGAKAAQADFIEGVLLLHSFSYDDAAEAFQRAQRLDPSFAMAYWGEAMTYYHAVWGEQDIPAGRKALGKLAATPEQRVAKAKTPREKAYLRAVESLFGEQDTKTRLTKFAESMGELSLAHPHDLEAKTFYSLAMLGASQGVREERSYMSAAGLALDVLDVAPEHPGALHYLIHSVDDPIHAPIGLSAAKKYGEVAASVGHAVHMPSHIYGPLGMWREALVANQKSWDIGEARVKQKKLGSEQRDFHALAWLHDVHLQLGQYDKARERLETLAKEIEHSNSPLARRYYTHMQSVHYWTVGPKQGLLAFKDVKADDLETSRFASQLSTSALAALEKSDAAKAREVIGKISDRIKTARAKLSPSAAKATAHCATHVYSVESPTSLTNAEIIKLQLEAKLALLEGKDDEALTLAKEAAVQSDSLSFSDGPPMPSMPAHEFLGDMYHRSGNYREAMDEYQRSLASTQPHRSLTLLKLARAASQGKDHATCQSALGELRGYWKDADAQVKSLLPTCAS